eukprot:960169-Pelagomonas_calceolata.AAC.1
MLDAFREFLREEFNRLEQADVRNIVALHVWWQPQFVCHRCKDFDDSEGTGEFGAQFRVVPSFRCRE